MLLSDCEDLTVERGGQTLVRVERVVGGLRAIAGKAFGSSPDYTRIIQHYTRDQLHVFGKVTEAI